MKDTKLCMSDSHPNGMKPEAQFALRLDFALRKKGFRNKTQTAYLELYACVRCATQESADLFKNTKDTTELGQMISVASFANGLDLEASKVYWAPRDEADRFFSAVNKREDQENMKRAEELVNQTRNGPINNTRSESGEGE